MVCKRLFLLMFSTLFLLGAFTAQAADDSRVLNDVTASPAIDGQLKISVNSGGRYFIERCVGGKWTPQVFGSATNDAQHLFSMMIGSTLYVVRNTRVAGGDSRANLPSSRTAFSVENYGTDVTSGTVQRVAKEFTSKYNSQNFSVIVEIVYDKSKPDFILLKATINLSAITGSPRVRFAYGFDALLGGNDKGWAYTLPNASGYSNPLSTAQVNNLNLVAASNADGAGTLIGFLRMNKAFDFAASSYYYDAIPYKLFTSNNDFYFNTASPIDNGVGVGFDNIPSGIAGQVTSFNTGMFFSSAIPGDLSFHWDTADSPNLTVPGGDSASLKLIYTTAAASQVTGIGVKVNLPPSLTATGTHTNNFLNQGTFAFDAANTFYHLTNATADAASTNTLTISVNTMKAGQFTMNIASFTEETQMIVVGSTATLTVMAEASFDDFANANNVKLYGGDQEYTFKVKFKNGVTAAENVVVNLDYSNTTNFVTGSGYNPSTVTIPAGQNFIEFKVKSVPAPSTAVLPMSITLTNPDKPYATVSGTEKTVTISASPGYIHINPHLRGSLKE